MQPEIEIQSRALAPIGAWRPLPSSWVLPIRGRQGGSRPRLPPGDVIGVWPPNSILTATLPPLATAGIGAYLLAASRPHLAGELPADFPIPWCWRSRDQLQSEASWPPSACAGLPTPRRGSTRSGGWWPSSVGACSSPLRLFVPDAAAVNLLHGEPYWLVWRTRSSPTS